MPFPFTWPLQFPNTDADYPASADAYARQLKALFPPGDAFDLEVGSVIDQVCRALGIELSRVDSRGFDMLAEADPRTANETLSDWDRVLGLPDLEVPVIPTDVPTHQVAVTAKYVARGGQNYQFFADLVAAAGYTLASIEAFSGEQATCDGYCNQALYGAIYAYAFQLNINPPAGGVAHVDHATLTAIIKRKTHSHVIAIVNFL